MYKKTYIILTIIIFLILGFVQRCTSVNLTTADIFQPKIYNSFKELLDTVSSENYEIMPIQGDFPILFDSIKNEFYLGNDKGLTKINAQGKIIISNSLPKEETTSARPYSFVNYTPFVFSKNGVYDFSGNELVYSDFFETFNADKKINKKDFYAFFEKKYNDAEVVIYDTNHAFTFGDSQYPMYLKTKNKWTLIYSPESDYNFTHLLSRYDATDTIGQIDYKGFPAKFNHKRLMVLKNNRLKNYSTPDNYQRIDDSYLSQPIDQILKEQKFNYEAPNKTEIIGYKKDRRRSSGGFSPDWFFPSFICTAYYKITFSNEELFLKEKTTKYSGSFDNWSYMYLYEIPKKLREKNKIAFLNYGLNLGSLQSMDTGITTPVINNTGIYLIRPKLED